MYNEDNEEFKPVCSFGTYLAEGDKLCNAAEYYKALESYDMALKTDQENKSAALVARSKCYLLIGDTHASLQDAESSLKENKEFHKGLFRKAEALYQMGDFEQALVFYHRGYKLRPELEEFRLGIQKSREAIENCVGTPDSVTLENKGDLSFFDKMDEGKLKARGKYRLAENLAAARGARATNQKTNANSKTVKTLLGELHVERKFLEKLSKDADLLKGSSKGIHIYDLVSSGISYLDIRIEFWRQQKPLYARKRDRMLLEEQWNRKPLAPRDPTSFILKNLEAIDAYLTEGKSSESLVLALSTLKSVSKLSDAEFLNKADVLGNLHSCIGNAYLELDQGDKALKHHQEDLEIAKKNNFQEARSRAFDNLGRVHARIGNYQKAIDCWEEKLPLSKSVIENTWLYHEIGRCHLALGSYDKAREYGQKSFDESIKAEDDVWQLNAGVLIAQAEVKLENYEDAIKSFNQCLENAQQQGDEVAESAINKALEEVEEKLRSKESQEEKTENDDFQRETFTEEKPDES